MSGPPDFKAFFQLPASSPCTCKDQGCPAPPLVARHASIMVFRMGKQGMMTLDWQLESQLPTLKIWEFSHKHLDFQLFREGKGERRLPWACVPAQPSPFAMDCTFCPLRPHHLLLFHTAGITPMQALLALCLIYHVLQLIKFCLNSFVTHKPWCSHVGSVRWWLKWA